jgi:hypothetical protein
MLPLLQDKDVHAHPTVYNDPIMQKRHLTIRVAIPKQRCKELNAALVTLGSKRIPGVKDFIRSREKQALRREFDNS